MKLRQDFRGVTLLEIMIAIAVITVLLMGLFASMTTALYTSENARVNTKLQKFAQQVMEEIMAEPFDNLAIWHNKGIDYQGLRAEITVHDFAVDLKQITVFVRVQGRDRPTLLISTLRPKI